MVGLGVFCPLSLFLDQSCQLKAREIVRELIVCFACVLHLLTFASNNILEVTQEGSLPKLFKEFHPKLSRK